MSRLLLTSVSGIPIIIRCDTVGEINKFSCKGAIEMSEKCFEINKHEWTDESSNRLVVDLIDNVVGANKCWIRKADA